MQRSSPRCAGGASGVPIPAGELQTGGVRSVDTYIAVTIKTKKCQIGVYGGWNKIENYLSWQRSSDQD